MNNRDSNNGE